MPESSRCRKKTDEELVKLTLKDEEFYLCIVRRYEDKLARYIRRITNINNEETEDILQEIFIKVYRNLNDFDQNLKFSSWIYRIARNMTIDHYRRRETRPRIMEIEENEIFLSLIEDKSHFLDEIDHKLLSHSINKVLNQLKDKYREVLILRFLEEKSYEEISDILRVPIGTVGTLINRGKKEFITTTKNMKINFKE